MSKKSKRRAFFVYVIICLLYVFVGVGLPGKMSMTRISAGQPIPSKGTILPLPNSNTVPNIFPPQGAPSLASVPQAVADVAEDVQAPDAIKATAPSADAQSPDAQSAIVTPPGLEPSLLISVPVVCYALRAGWVEKESLIFGKKDAYNNIGWRKPIEILKDHDEEGIKNILTTIGQKRVVEFMKKEGIGLKAALSPEDVILGRGYTVQKEKLIALYEKYAGEAGDDLFPFSSGRFGIEKGPSGFRLIKGRGEGRDAAGSAEEEWMMPNLANLPMRSAIEKLSAHTSRIRIVGGGQVLNQTPRPFERLKGESECVIQGRAEEP